MFRDPSTSPPFLWSDSKKIVADLWWRSEVGARPSSLSSLRPTCVANFETRGVAVKRGTTRNASLLRRCVVKGSATRPKNLESRPRSLLKDLRGRDDGGEGGKTKMGAVLEEVGVSQAGHSPCPRRQGGRRRGRRVRRGGGPIGPPNWVAATKSLPEHVPASPATGSGP